MKKKLFITAIITLSLLYIACTELKGHANPYDPDYAGDTPGGSSSSSSSSAGTGTGPVAAPVNLSATFTNATQIILTWDAVSNADYYKVFRSQNSNLIIANPGSPLTNYYVDTTAGPGFYYYRVTAHNSSFDSSDSQIVSGAIWDAIYVSTAGNDLNDGTIVAPVKNLNEAVLRSGTMKDIKVAQGTYTAANGGLNPGGPMLSVTNHFLHFTGGWDSVYSTRPGYSILDGEGTGYRIVEIDSYSNTTMDSFKVINGYRISWQGIGMRLDQAWNTTLTNVIVSNNIIGTSGGDGAGLYVQNCRNFQFYGTIARNQIISTDYYRGGGINLLGCYIVYIDALISSNYSGEDGGGINIAGGGEYNIRGTIERNFAYGEGGGIALSSSGGPAFGNFIIDAAFNNNTAITNGGAISYVASIYTNLDTSGATFSGNVPNNVFAQ